MVGEIEPRLPEVLEQVTGQVAVGLKQYGLDLEAKKAESFGLGLEIITASRYKTWQDSGHWQGRVVEGDIWPVLLVLGEGVRREAIGSLNINEYEGSAENGVPVGLHIERTNGRGIKNTLLAASVETRSSEERWLRRNDKDGFYAVSVEPHSATQGQEVKVLAFLYQHKGEGLSITPFSVSTTGQALKQLERMDDFTSLKQAKVKIEAETKTAMTEEDLEVDLSEVWQPEGDILFEAVRMGLGTDPKERAKDGVAGERFRVAWLNKAGESVVSGRAWKAGYFDAKMYKVMVTHVFATMENVSRSGLENGLLSQAVNPEDKTDVEIFLLKDGTIKVDAGGGIKEVKETEEKKLWTAVLVEMRVGAIDRNRR